MKFILSFILGGLITYTFSVVLIKDYYQTAVEADLEEKWADRWESLYQAKYRYESRYQDCFLTDWQKRYNQCNLWVLNNCGEK